MLTLSEKNKNYLFTSNSSNNNSLLNRAISTNLSANIKTNNNQKDLNLISFIKSKDKMKISNFFDEKKSKEFLSSKELALKKIKFNHELLNKPDDSDNKIKNEQSTKEKKVYSSMKNFSTNNLKAFRIKYGDKIGAKDLFNDSQIYKFIIANTHEKDEQFYKKLQKEIKKAETKKKNKKKEDISEYVNKLKNSLNPFKFSDKAKTLMENEDIELSSINEDTTIQAEESNKKRWNFFISEIKEK